VLHEVVQTSPILAPTSRGKYLRDLNRWIDFAGTDPRSWTPERVEAFRAYLHEQKLLPRSIDRLLSSVQFAAYWWAEREGDPALNFAPTRQQPALTKEAAIELLTSCDTSPQGKRDFALIVVGLETGMRRVALAGMDIDYTWSVDHAFTGYPATVVPLGDERKPFRVPLSYTAALALKPWLTWLGSRRGPVFRPLTKRLVRDGQYEWINSTKALSASAIQKMLSARGGVDPQVFRATFVSWRLAAGYTPEEIAIVTDPPRDPVPPSLIQLAHKMTRSTPEWLAKLVEERPV